MKIGFIAATQKWVLLISATALLLLNSSLSAQEEVLSDMPSGSYTLDLSHASIIWKVSHFGFSSYPGRFTNFDVDLNLDSGDFTKSNLTVTIDVDSIQTAYPTPEEEDFDAKLAQEWFKSGEHPQISFVSSSVSELDGNAFTISGEMSMAGQSHPVTLNAVLNKFVTKHPFYNKPVIGFSAKATLDRTQWGIDKYAPAVGADVSIEIEAEFQFDGE